MATVYCFAGPNGAGKTTLALKLLPALGVRHFVNADAIAAGLSPLDVSLAQFSAGRLMLERLRELKENGEDFGFETTFASNAAPRFLQQMSQRSATVHLHYVWLQSVDLAVARVQARVRAGGHFIEEDVVRRRYAKSLERLRSYITAETDLTIYDNSGRDYEVVARRKNEIFEVMQPAIWREISDAR